MYFRLGQLIDFKFGKWMYFKLGKSSLARAKDIFYVLAGPSNFDSSTQGR